MQKYKFYPTFKTNLPSLEIRFFCINLPLKLYSVWFYVFY